MNSSPKLKQILTELRRQMNGAVSQTMRELGQKEALNFGVSLPTIKEISLRYAPDHELANELAMRNSREAHIAALYIADPSLLTTEQMQTWSDQWQTEEIARLSGMLLFYKSDYAAEIASRWLESDQLPHAAALYIIGRLAAKINNTLIERVLSLKENQNSASVFCLREIYLSREEFRLRIDSIAKSNPELQWQITPY